MNRNTLLLGSGALVLLSFSVLGLFVYVNQTAPDETQKLEIALRLLRKGDGEASTRIARTIDPKSLKKRSDLSKREFLLGTSERKAAELIAQRRIANDKNELAVKHLQKSQELTFPDGYEGQGNFLLGMALFDLLRWDEAEQPLEIASERWPQGRADAIERLVDIDISPENNDPDSALSRIERWRSLPRSATDELDRTVIKEMQILYSRGDYELSMSQMESISPGTEHRSAAELLFGRCLMRLAERDSMEARDPRLRQALTSFQRAIDSTACTVKHRRQSNLEMGRVLRSLGRTTEALSVFGILRLSSPYEAESLAGGLDEIDCLIDLGRITEAANSIELISQGFGELKWYANDWIPISAFRTQVVGSGDRMIKSKSFADAARFAEALPPFCDETDRLRMRSRIYEGWAFDSNNQVDNIKKNGYHKSAAEAFESLSRKLIRTPEFDELLWRAIENYRLAGAFQKSNLLLESFLDYELRENQPKGLLTMARNFNQLDQPDKAMHSLNRLLVSNTKTPLRYEARLEAARIQSTRDEFQAAEELILQNLYYSDLTPESPVWRESLFLLGELLFRRGERLYTQASEAISQNPNKTLENLSKIEKSYEELNRSIARMEEGLRRFERDPRRMQMLYTTAKAYQMAAKLPEILLQENQSANEDTISRWRTQRKDLLNQARDSFARLRQEVNATSDNSQPSTSTESFLRNSYFGEANLLNDAGMYEEAIVAYQEAANRFISEPESIEAMTQVAACQKQQGKMSESRRTLEIAKDILGRISPDKNPRFRTVTGHDRAGWERYIDWLINDLKENR